MRRAILLAAVLALAAPAAAHAAGGGLSASYGGRAGTRPGGEDGHIAGAAPPGSVGQGVHGGRAITGPEGKYGYIAVPARHDSVVQVFHDGLWVRWRTFSGAFAIPQAAWDGTKTGLSADGGTLVLAEIPDTYPVRRTRLIVL